MYTHFKEREMHKAYHSPKMGCSINHFKESQIRYHQDALGSKQYTSIWWVKQTYLNTQDRQVRHNTYIHIFGTKTKHAKGQVTYNKHEELKYKLPQGETLDIRYRW